MTKAVQYLRMSTDMQDCSIAYQMAHNEAYAQARGYDLVGAYRDEGISGLDIERRPGLQRLIADMTGGGHEGTVVLVFDISRWGRFQNPDEAAYYEFMCWKAGVRIEYTAEPSLNDGTLTATLVKSIKRVMAAEFSRELSLRQTVSKRALICRGHWTSGPAPYGFVRQLRGPKGEEGPILESGERITMRGYHPVLRPGPDHEVQTVAKIFRLYNRGGTEQSVTDRLNKDGPPFRGGGRWMLATVAYILRNEIYTGTMVYGRAQAHLGTVTRTSAERQVRLEGYVEPLVSKAVFERARKQRISRKQAAPRAALLAGLRRVLDREGELGSAQINKARDCASPRTFIRVFGSLLEAYRQVGYIAPPAHLEFAAKLRRGDIRPGRAVQVSDEKLLKGLRAFVAAGGRLSVETIEQCPDLHSPYVYRRRFGGLRRAYALAGYQPSRRQDGGLDSHPGQTISKTEAANLLRERLQSEQAL